MGKNVNLLFSGSACLPADFNIFLICFSQAVIVIFIHFSPTADLRFTAEPCAFRFPFSSSFLLYLFYYFISFLRPGQQFFDPSAEQVERTHRQRYRFLPRGRLP